MPLLKNGEIITSDDNEFIDWQAWLEKRSDKHEHNQEAHNQKIAIAFPNDLDPVLMQADLEKFAIIALTFPAFRDGRAYSQARILREHLGFKGELRATGEVLVDQAFFMLRCGFDVLVLPENADIEAWKKALTDFSLFYQPAKQDALATIWELRHRK